MIQFYAGVIKQNDLAIEYVDEFFPVRIAESDNIELYTAEQGFICTRAKVKINTAENENYENNVDVIPTNFITLYRDAFGLADDDNDISVLVNTKLNFFSSESIDTKLNFEMQIIGTSNYNKNLTFVFGDIKRNILMKGNSYWLYYNGVPEYLCLVGATGLGTNFIEMLDYYKERERLYFQNGFYDNMMHSPAYAPFYFYHNANPNTINDYNSLTDGGIYKGDLNVLNSYTNNLTRWSNWHTMITGNYWYGNPFTIDLLEPVRGIDKIELTVPISPHGYDNGLEFDSYYGADEENKITYKSRGFSYYTTGTDVTNLFNQNTNEEQIVFLKNGFLKRYYIEDETTYENRGIHYQLSINGEGLDVFIGTTKINSLSNFDNRGLNLMGLSLCVPPNFAIVDASFWIRDISEEYDKYEYGNCPIFFGSYAIQNAQISYVDYEIFPTDLAVAGLVTNFAYKRYYYGNNFITDDIPISYAFWESFLTGLFDGEDGPNIGGGSIGGGNSTTGGGGGSFNDNSYNVNDFNDVINFSQDTIRNSLFLNMYVLDKAAIISFAGKCWDTNWELSDITRYFGDNYNPMQSVIGVKYYPMILPTTGSTGGSIRVCGQTFTNLAGNYQYLGNDLFPISFGSIYMEEYFGSYVDYEETNISLVLPFVGIQKLETREIMGGTIKLDAYIDVIDGTITYYLSLTKNNSTNIINTWKGVCAFDYPMSSFDNIDKMNTIMGGITGVATTAIGGGLLGGAPGAAIGAAAGLIGVATNALSTKPSVTKSGNFAGSRTSINKAYLIIERPKMSLPENYGHHVGYPSNITTKLKYVEGFTMVSSIHLENMGIATSEEISEIETLLKQGVIF